MTRYGITPLDRRGAGILSSPPALTDAGRGPLAPSRLSVMACAAAVSAVGFSSNTAANRDAGDKGLRRSESGNELQCIGAPRGMNMRRSASEPVLLRCSHESSRKPTGPPHAATAPAVATKLRNSRSVGIFPSSTTGIPTKSVALFVDPDSAKAMNLLDTELELQLGKRNDNIVVPVDDLDGTSTPVSDREGLQDVLHTAGKKGQQQRVHWVRRILQLRRQWRDRQNKDADIHGHCEISYDDDDDDEDGEEAANNIGTYQQLIDVTSFAKHLSHVPLHTAELFSKLAFLCNRAYTIRDLQAEELRTQRLQWVTSSLERKSDQAAAAITAQLDTDSIRFPPLPPPHASVHQQHDPLPTPRRPTRPSIAYRIAASAASYVHSRAKGLLSLATPPASQEGESGGGLVEPPCTTPYKPQAAACMAASTMTAVVAVEENAKLEAARDLSSPHKSPCDWYVCDDHATCTRYFVIQGSDSLASWQANLFFEPISFEETEALVHRGIYEAAKGIYEQFMPLVQAHLQRYGNRARFQFTGHSLGGSLSMLINLMLLGRGVLERHMLLPVVTFGSPFVFCGGRGVLDELGLDEEHVLTVIMHRDIVPRAFACTYPNRVSQILKRLCGTFKSHPCLNYEKLLYTPLGRVFILQPDESSSPSHPFLPSGSGLFALDTKKSSRSELMMAIRAFLNTPHPLETLSDPTAYGSEGTILRDHDSGNYLGAVNTVLERERKQLAVMNRLKKPNGRVQHHVSHLRLLPDKSCCDHHRRSHQGRELDVELVGTELVVGM